MNEQYQNALRQITAPEELEQRTLRQMRSQFQQQRQGRQWWKLPVAAVCGLCLFGAVPVMAAHVPAVAVVLEQLSPELARMLVPVELSCTDNGIRMQVEAVVQSEEEILAYLTVQDLEADRVDETLDLYDYVIDGYHTFTHNMVSYDAEQKKALLELRAYHGDLAAPSKTVLQVNSFLSKEQVYEQVPVAVQGAAERPETMQVQSTGGGGELFAELAKLSDEEGLLDIQVLKPGEAQALREDIGFVQITGIGYVDGVLHIQTRWDDSVDNHGYLTARTADGREVYASNASFYLNADYLNADYLNVDGTPASTLGEGADRQSYIEYEFAIPPEELAQWQISATLFAEHCYTEGHWKVSFRADSMRSITLGPKELPGLPEGVEQIIISPLSVTLAGAQDAVDGWQLEVDDEQHRLRLVKAKDGYHHLWIDGDSSVAKNRLETDSFLDLDSLQTLEIDGQTFTLPKA